MSGATSTPPEPLPEFTHCEGCTQAFTTWDDRFRCRWGCWGDFHAECQIVHHDDHDRLMLKEA